MQRLPQATNLLLLSVSLSILSTLPWCLVCGLSSISLPSSTISAHECELKMVARHWGMGFFNNRRGKNWSNGGLKGVGLQRWGRKKYVKYNSKIEGKVAYSGMKLEFLCILCSRLLEMDLLEKKLSRMRIFRNSYVCVSIWTSRNFERFLEEDTHVYQC